MQPAVTLETPVRYLKGVGPERSKLLARLELETIGDLFRFYPRRYEDRTRVKPVSALTGQDKECVEGVIRAASLVRLRGGQTIFKATVSDGRGAPLFAAWFNQPYLAKLITPPARIRLYGKAEREGTHFRMAHPEFELRADGGEPPRVHSARIVPVYPLTEDLGQKGLSQLIHHVTEDYLGLLRDPLPLALRKRLGLADLVFASRQIHFPDGEADLKRARERLVFDEFFALQLAVLKKRAELTRENPELSHAGGDAVVERLLAGLPFPLTRAQRACIEEVLADMRRTRPMNRLVQGDVGSGKTVVAAAALAFTAANSFQGALMAPTEVLAQQLFVVLSQLLEPLGIRCSLLSQGLAPDERARALEEARSGATAVFVGTHALIQDAVRFRRLGLAIIDEQHKFGVIQRAALRDKAASPPHFLLMTATPIPRTLAMTLYGDLDISAIAEMPKGRKPVRTAWLGQAQRPQVYAMLDAQLAKGRQAYVICPSIDASGGAKTALAAHRELSALLAHRRVGLLHGRMKAAEKARVMREFKEGKLEVLVSTVVIEVGVDVPNASMMLVENAERFGLAQLHQLRGRVGRGDEESFCILFSDAPGEETAERLGALEGTASGFDLAEKDLELRGGGDPLGRQQHGLPALQIGDLCRDASILALARREAAAVVERDPELKTAASAPYRRLLDARFGAADQRPLATA